MRPLLSTSQSLELDAFTREVFDFSSDHLMEVAAMRLWQVLKLEIIQKRLNLCQPAALRDPERRVSLAAVCGKGDNAGDALAVLRHAKLEGFQNLAAFVPEPDTLKENVRLNLRRAEQCGVEIVRYETAEEGALQGKLLRHDIILDAVLGTGAHGRARGSAARAMQMFEVLDQTQAKNGDKAPCIVAIDIPSGLGDDWQPDYPIVRADATLCIEPMKEALYMPAARSFAGDIVPVGGIFPLWADAAASNVWLLEHSEVRDFLPPISKWAHKMQRGRVAVLAGSQRGAGAALHCVRGAAAAGAGYIALYCDEEMFSSYLATVGDVAIVRVLTEDTFLPESWDAIVAGPGWGTDERREEVLDQLIHSDTALVLDADAVRLFARRAGQNRDHPRFFKAPVILTPHPGEFRELLPFLDSGESSSACNVSETVGQVASLAKKFGIILALRASTTHIAFPDGTCAIFDGSASGLGIAGSGDVLSGLAGGLLARWIAFSKENGAGKEYEDNKLWHNNLVQAIIGAVLVHGGAGRKLSQTKGWFTPADLAHACARMTSESKLG
ncbi:MAG: NAD(P)H-hydrate dehydratase [Rectinema sp.]